MNKNKTRAELLVNYSCNGSEVTPNMRKLIVFIKWYIHRFFWFMIMDR